MANPDTPPLKKTDPALFAQVFKDVQKEIRILMLLPDDVYDLYQEALQKRISVFEMPVQIATPGAAKIEKYFSVLSFRCPGTVNNEEGPLIADQFSQEFLFKIQGTPAPETLTLTQWGNQEFTPLEQRFEILKNQVAEKKGNTAFMKLAFNQSILQQRMLKLQKLQSEIGEVDQKISQVDTPYYQDLDYILSEAVEIITGVEAEQEKKIMKGLMKILLVDDLNQKTVTGLIAQGYVRKNLSTMTLFELQQNYKTFLKQSPNANSDQKKPLKQFLLDSPELEPYDIIYINHWNYHEGKLPVQLRIKRNPVFSKKEEQILEQDPQKMEEAVAKLEQKRDDLEQQLEQATEELEIAEKMGKLAEDKYQEMVKQRKRILNNLKKAVSQLREVQFPHTPETKMAFYTRGLIKTFRQHQTMSEQLQETLDQWQMTRFLKSQFSTDTRLSQLKKMLGLAQSRQQMGLISEKLERQVNSLAKKLEHFAIISNLWQNEGGYQPMLDNFILDLLESAILASVIESINSRMQRHQERATRI